MQHALTMNRTANKAVSCSQKPHLLSPKPGLRLGGCESLLDCSVCPDTSALLPDWKPLTENGHSKLKMEKKRKMA